MSNNRRPKGLGVGILFALLFGALVLSVPTPASAQCGMFGMIGACTPAAYGAGMTCTGTLFIGCYAPAGITMTVPCVGGFPAPGLGVGVANNLSVMGGAMCSDMGFTTMVGTKTATAYGSVSAAECRVNWNLMCAITGTLGGMATMGLNGPGTMCVGPTGNGNQTIVRGCFFDATPGTNNGGLPVELMEFSVEPEESAD